MLSLGLFISISSASCFWLVAAAVLTFITIGPAMALWIVTEYDKRQRTKPMSQRDFYYSVWSDDEACTEEAKTQLYRSQVR